MKARRRAVSGDERRTQLTYAIGGQVSRFQEASYAFDDIAAEILAVHRADLPVMTALLFEGAASTDELVAALHLRRPAVRATLERLQLAGYARVQPDAPGRVELTDHARSWIERIWAPLRQGGVELLDGYSPSDLAVIARFVAKATALQEARTTALRAWLAQPAGRARRSHLRGGLSPAALERVQVYVEANLADPIPLSALADRAGLSPFHFARAFKTTVGTTPRTFVEQRRVERAKRLLVETGQPIADIAVNAGFGTQSRMTFVFKRGTGFTPAVYRRGRA
jgi:AraC family transcriptional regulator